MSYGVFSEGQKKYGGSWLYYSARGQVVEVTEVFDTREKAEKSKWADKICTGKLGELIRIMEAPKIVLWE
jgi:hypothetical protein